MRALSTLGPGTSGMTAHARRPRALAASLTVLLLLHHLVGALLVVAALALPLLIFI